MALRLRRGTNAERLTITPEIGELIYTTDTKKVFVGDGATVGGTAIDTGLLDLAGNSLNDLGDVVIGEDSSAPTEGQVLGWDATNSYWAPQDAATPDLSTSVISDLSDVGIGVINNGQVLVWNDTASQFQPGDVLGLTTELSDLTDVADQAPNDTQVLAWNATSLNWEPTDAATPDLTSAVISDLSDVAISVINSGQILVWDGTNFVPGDAGGDVVTDTTPELGGNLDAGGFNITNANAIGAISVNATNFTGNFIGTHSGDFNGDFDGNFVGSIYNEDSAIVFDAESNTLNNLVSATATEFVGDLTGDVTGNVVGNVTGGVVGDVQGSVFADDSSIMVDAINETFAGDSITLNNSITTPEINSTTGEIITNAVGAQPARFTFNRDNAGALATTQSIGRMLIKKTDTDTSTETVVGSHSMSEDTYIWVHAPGGTYDYNNYVTFHKTGKVAISMGQANISAEPAAHLEVGGAIKPGVYADVAARDAAITAPVAGMMVFNTTGAKFQGYDGTAWVDLN